MHHTDQCRAIYVPDADLRYAITMFGCRGEIFYTPLIHCCTEMRVVYADREGWPDIQ
jgi:hypothetical protein